CTVPTLLSILTSRSLCTLLFFFFSSRRRHTRWPRDWSSDVCSSDLSTLCRTSTLTTAGPTRSAAPVTAREYASSSSSSCGVGERGAVWGGTTVSSETSTGAAFMV